MPITGASGGIIGADNTPAAAGDGCVTAVTSTGCYTPTSTTTTVIVVGGGGGACTGGGGAGGVMVVSCHPLPTSNVPVTIGAGGPHVPSAEPSCGNGNDSSVAYITSTGGGTGGNDGGSGGGGRYVPNAPGNVIGNGCTRLSSPALPGRQGNDGGTTASAPNGGGGGGGAGGAGTAAPGATGGAGGAGSGHVFVSSRSCALLRSYPHARKLTGHNYC